MYMFLYREYILLLEVQTFRKWYLWDSNKEKEAELKVGHSYGFRSSKNNYIHAELWAVLIHPALNVGMDE